MAFSVAFTRLLPLYPNGVFLQWDLLNVTEVGSYDFDLYRAGSPSGPWTVIAPGSVNIYNFKDVMPLTINPTNSPVNQLSLVRGIFYRIVATAPSGATAEAISAVEPQLDGRQRLLKRKFLRDETIMLQKLNGVPIAVLKRMHWGPRCTVCWDKTTKQVVRANCSTCLGTGFIPGYFLPLITLARRGTLPVTKQVTPQGISEYRPTQVTLLDLPKVEPDDVLVFLKDNKRFVVKAAIQTELLTVGVHQKFEVSELAHSSVEYRIPVDPSRIPPIF